ncbi:FtsK/SpoIIIE domain-containing protein [Phytohabitans rumicis]|uniref:FtsK/SpoIIIE domain-containing protein n=1 Tax=Phytohabitans rumicis TaxID=1076125 RepID=UPI001563B953|nr:FtsK/SpoIIIE domain-containing protein [Phytohabitans rumicis]
MAILAAFPRRWRRVGWPWLGRAAERAYIAVCVLLGGGWLAVATVAGPTAKPLPVLALVGVLICAVPWWAHRRRRAKVRIERILDGWPIVADAAGLTGSRVVSALGDEWGWRARIALPRGQTAAQVVNAIPAIESGLGVAPGAARAEPDPHRADRAYLRVLDKDPHADAIAYVRPEPGSASIHHPIPLGLFDDGSVVRVPLLRRNGLVGGVTDSGKSGVLNVALAYLAQCPDVAIWGIDLKGGMELAPWAPCMARFATTPAKAVAFLTAAVEEIQLREAEQVARGERVWEPTPDRPALVIVIDEYVELPDEAHPHADTIARLGRAVAVNLLIATQRPTQKAMTHNAVRSQMDIRICLRVRERRDVTLILGDGMLAAGWNAHKLDLPGKFLVSAREPQFQVPRPARAYYITLRDINSIVGEYGEYSPHTNADMPSEFDPDTYLVTDSGTEPPTAETFATPADVAVIDRPPTPERVLLEALRNAPEEGVTVPELVAVTEKPRVWVYRRLKQLSDAGHAHQVTWGHWRATTTTNPPDPT